jgi:hypothetical protein
VNETLTEEPRTESICSEEFFHRTLVLERKRTERTGRPFLLVFLDVGELLSDRVRPAEVLTEALARALEASTRDIDVKGWYRRDAVLGIICTEVAKSAMEPVVAKIKKRLVAAFGQDGVKKIKMFLIHYPELEQGPGNASRAIPIPELRPERKGMFYS